jgi:hypothetical protein
MVAAEEAGREKRRGRPRDRLSARSVRWGEGSGLVTFDDGARSEGEEGGGQ